MSFAEPIKMPRANGERAHYGSDDGLFVVFEKRPVFLEARSKLEGREIWEDRDFIVIQQPGAKTDVQREVRKDGLPNFPSDIERFSRQWAMFQSAHEQTQVGVPLEQWAGISKSRVLEFKAQRIHTVEQLAELPDSIMQTLGMGARELRGQAKAYLDSAAAGAELAKANARTADLENEVETMRNQLKELAAAQNGIAEVKRGPGRPRKDDSNDV